MKKINIIITNQHCDNRGDESATIGLIEEIYNNFGHNVEISLFKQTSDYRFLPHQYQVNEEDMIINPIGLLQLLIWCFLKTLNINVDSLFSKSIRKFVLAHKSADIIISSCGGPYIGDIYGTHEIVHLLHLFVPVLLKKKVVFAAPSMGPFTNKLLNPWRKYILDKCDLIILRDRISYNYVVAFINNTDKVFLAADACFAHKIEGKHEPIVKDKIIGFTPLKYKYPNSDNPKYEFEKYKEIIVRFFDILMENDPELVIEFFPQLYNKHSDLPIIYEMISSMKYKDRTIVFSNNKNGVEQQLEISKLNTMIATRYHSAVFACKMQVPCICIAYEHKAVAMMESFELSDYTLDINNLTFEKLSNTFTLLTSNLEIINNSLKKNTNKITSSSKSTIQRIHDLYKGNETKRRSSKYFVDSKIKFPQLCRSCGACEGICPQYAIRMEKNQYKQYIPNLFLDECIDCDKCNKICPVQENMFNDTIIGKYRKIVIAKSTDSEINKRGSSGGVVSQLLSFGIDNHYFKQIITVENQENKIIADPIIVDSNTNIPSGSKYISSPLLRNLKHFTKESVITVLPCEAQAIRNVNTDIIIFGLFCSKLSNEDLINYLIQKSNCHYDDIVDINYRNGEWPGNVEIKFKDNGVFRYKLTRSIFTAIYNSYYYTNSGCLLCNDYTAEHADISFGDPWGGKQYQKDEFGSTLVIIRSERGENLFNHAVEKGIITAEEYPIEKLITGHIKEIFSKKIAIKDRIMKFNSKSLQKIGYRNQSNSEPFRYWFATKILNTYMINNNWRRRKTLNSYESIKTKNPRVIFFTRYANALLVNLLLGKRRIIRKINKLVANEKL